MNRHGSNNPLPLWGSLLVLPILALAVYLHFKPAPEQMVPELTPLNAVAQSEAIAPRSVETAGPIVVDAPAALSDVSAAPVGLDPEVARTAVQQVENSVYERATAMFEQEPVDVEWAAAYEQSLRAMFAQYQGLQRVSINSISCHTSMCRIEVFTPRDADADFFTAMFYDGLANFRAGELKAEAAITRRMEQGMTSVYVARKDHTLGFY
ncbi:hypothetical protein [Cellvibrio sp. UBA7671]|uniref:hypothetical protein n=1 Tax=Cellvibrio sp. UBA7671 TaxID=1946312 RepID=UPI002F35B005